MSKRLMVYTVGAAVVLAVCFTWVSFLLNAPVAVHPPITFEIAPGESAARVARRLEDAGVIRSARILLLMARLHRLDREFRHGTHEFAGALTPDHVLSELLTAPQPTVRITIPEGLTWLEVGELLEANGIVSADSYYQAVCDPALLRAAGAAAEANCAEGFLYPDTYNLAPDMSAKEIARLQLQRFREVLAGLLDEVAHHDRRQQAAQAQAASEPSGEPADVRDTLVLASIIEKETSIAAERALVSSVFHNRLQRGMRLQADPTVIYGLQAAGTPWDGTLLHKQLRKPGPYNTYTVAGLPPGPICNPGEASLRAALMPARSGYVFFVAAGDGSHRFSQTLEQHNQAVAQLRGR